MIQYTVIAEIDQSVLALIKSEYNYRLNDVLEFANSRWLVTGVRHTFNLKKSWFGSIVDYKPQSIILYVKTSFGVSE